MTNRVEIYEPFKVYKVHSKSDLCPCLETEIEIWFGERLLNLYIERMRLQRAVVSCLSLGVEFGGFMRLGRRLIHF